MRNFILLLLCLFCLAASCKKEDTPATPTTPTTPTTPVNNTNTMNGNWKGTVYDGAVVATPQDVKYNATATSTTAGTVNFDITFDGTAHKKEDATYTLAADNKSVTFA